MKIGIKTNHPNRKTDLDQYSLEFFEIFFVRNEQKMFFGILRYMQNNMNFLRKCSLRS